MDKNTARDMMLMVSTILPEHVIIEEIKKASTEYLLTNSKESKDTLLMYSMLFCARASSGGDMQKAMENISKMRTLDEHRKIFETGKQ